MAIGEFRMRLKSQSRIALSVHENTIEEYIYVNQILVTEVSSGISRSI